MSYELGFYDPPLPMTASQEEKMTAPLISMASQHITQATMYHEIVRVRYYGTHTAGDSVVVKWIYVATGEEVFRWNAEWERSDDTWYQAWIGHLFNFEIYKAGSYRCEFIIAGESKGIIDFEITSTEYPEDYIPEGDPPSPPPDVPYGTVDGIITDAETGNPIKDAFVQIGILNDYSGIDGYYLIRFTEPISGILTVTANGYEDFTMFISANVGDTPTYNISMIPLEKGYIRGRVTDSETGNPLSSVNVSFSTYSTVTDSSGDYVLEVFEGFSGPVIFEKSGYETYEDFRTVGPSDDITINVVLIPIYAIVHFTSDPSGATIWYGASEMPFTTPHTHKADTHLSWPVVKYTLEGYQDTQFSIDVDVGEEKTYHQVMTPMFPGGIIGTVSDFDTGNPIQGATVYANGGNGITDSDGHYSIQNLAAGIYDVNCTKNGYNSESTMAEVIADTSIEVNFYLISILSVYNGDAIQVTFDLENTGNMTTDYYIYFIFGTLGESSIIYGPIRFGLNPGEAGRIGQSLILEDFIVDRTYSLTLSAQYPDGYELDNDSVVDVMYISPHTLIENHCDTSYQAQVYSDAYPGQSFTVNTYITITSVKLWLDALHSDVGQIYLSIMTTSNGIPTDLLAITSFNSSDVPDWPSSEFEIPINVDLSPGIYAIVLSGSIPRYGNVITIHGEQNDNDPYISGKGMLYDPGWGGWKTDIGSDVGQTMDFWFEIIGYLVD